MFNTWRCLEVSRLTVAHFCFTHGFHLYPQFSSKYHINVGFSIICTFPLERIFGKHYTKRSLMSWVVVIPKEGRAQGPFYKTQPIWWTQRLLMSLWEGNNSLYFLTGTWVWQIRASREYTCFNMLYTKIQDQSSFGAVFTNAFFYMQLDMLGGFYWLTEGGQKLGIWNSISYTLWFEAHSANKAVTLAVTTCVEKGAIRTID